MRMTLRIRQNHSDPTHAVPTALILKEPDGKTLKYQFGTLRIYRNKDLIQIQADEITVNPQVAETLDYIRTRAIGIPVNRKPIPTTVKGVIHANITELR